MEDSIVSQLMEMGFTLAQAYQGVKRSSSLEGDANIRCSGCTGVWCLVPALFQAGLFYAGWFRKVPSCQVRPAQTLTNMAEKSHCGATLQALQVGCS